MPKSNNPRFPKAPNSPVNLSFQLILESKVFANPSIIPTILPFVNPYITSNTFFKVLSIPTIFSLFDGSANHSNIGLIKKYFKNPDSNPVIASQNLPPVLKITSPKPDFPVLIFSLLSKVALYELAFASFSALRRFCSIRNKLLKVLPTPFTVAPRPFTALVPALITGVSDKMAERGLAPF